MDCSTPGSSVLHCLPEFAQTHVHWVRVSNQPSHPLPPLLFLPSVFLSIMVFSNESTLYIRWPKYWNLNFSFSPSNKYSGLISFRIDRFDLLAVQGIVKSLLWRHSSKVSVLFFFFFNFFIIIFFIFSRFCNKLSKSVSSLTLSLLYGPTLL